MPSPYKHLSIEEREEIRVLLEKGESVRRIAGELLRAPSSISRELKRYKGQRYRAHEAQEQYAARRKRSVRQYVLQDEGLKQYVFEALNKQWSPEQISGRLKLERGCGEVSYTSIYRAIKKGLVPIVPKQCLRRKGRKQRENIEEKRGQIHGYKSIHDRPKSADNRTRYGHWEADTVWGASRKGALATFVDRKSRYVVCGRMQDRKAATMQRVMAQKFEGYPKKLRRTFTVDHGNEFFNYRETEAELGTAIYFADPYCAGQRGLNENTNGLLRQYFPKGTDFTALKDQDIAEVVSKLNNRPRKCLGYKTPAEVFPFKCCT